MRTKHERTRKEMWSTCRDRSRRQIGKQMEESKHCIVFDGHPSNGSFRAALTLINFASFISC